MAKVRNKVGQVSPKVDSTSGAMGDTQGDLVGLRGGQKASLNLQESATLKVRLSATDMDGFTGGCYRPNDVPSALAEVVEAAQARALRNRVVASCGEAFPGVKAVVEVDRFDYFRTNFRSVRVEQGDEAVREGATAAVEEILAGLAQDGEAAREMAKIREAFEAGRWDGIIQGLGLDPLIERAFRNVAARLDAPEVQGSERHQRALGIMLVDLIDVDAVESVASGTQVEFHRRPMAPGDDPSRLRGPRISWAGGGCGIANLPQLGPVWLQPGGENLGLAVPRYDCEGGQRSLSHLEVQTAVASEGADAYESVLPAYVRCFGEIAISYQPDGNLRVVGDPSLREELAEKGRLDEGAVFENACGNGWTIVDGPWQGNPLSLSDTASAMHEGPWTHTYYSGTWDHARWPLEDPMTVLANNGVIVLEWTPVTNYMRAKDVQQWLEATADFMRREGEESVTAESLMRDDLEWNASKA